MVLKRIRYMVTLSFIVLNFHEGIFKGVVRFVQTIEEEDHFMLTILNWPSQVFATFRKTATVTFSFIKN